MLLSIPFTFVIRHLNFVPFVIKDSIPYAGLITGCTCKLGMLHVLYENTAIRLNSNILKSLYLNRLFSLAEVNKHTYHLLNVWPLASPTYIPPQPAFFLVSCFPAYLNIIRKFGNN